MKLYYLFALLLVVTACKKDAEPDLSQNFVGNFHVTITNIVGATEINWKLSRKNKNHVNIVIERHIDFANSRPDRYDFISLKNILVESDNTLKFDNEYDIDNDKGKIVGIASLTGDTIALDVITIENGGAERTVEKLERK
jgi:hypothetical protein